MMMAAQPPAAHEHDQERPRTSRLGLTQTSLLHASDLQSIGPMFDVTFVGGRPGLVAVARPGGVAVHDVSAPSAPLLLREHVVPGLRGIAAGGGSTILAWGDRGVIRLDEGESTDILLPHAALGVAWTGRSWAVLGENGVELYDASFSSRCVVPGTLRPRSLRSLGPVLLALDDAGPVASLIEGAEEWTAIEHRDARLDWSRSTRIEYAGRPALFVPDRERGGSVVEINGASAVHVIRYHSDPWFWRAGRQGDVHVTLDRSGRGTVWQVAAERQV
jgi:hypothetical protein